MDRGENENNVWWSEDPTSRARLFYEPRGPDTLPRNPRQVDQDIIGGIYPICIEMPDRGLHYAIVEEKSPEDIYIWHLYIRKSTVNTCIVKNKD